MILYSCLIVSMHKHKDFYIKLNFTSSFAYTCLEACSKFTIEHILIWLTILTLHTSHIVDGELLHHDRYVKDHSARSIRLIRHTPMNTKIPKTDPFRVRSVSGSPTSFLNVKEMISVKKLAFRWFIVSEILWKLMFSTGGNV